MSVLKVETNIITCISIAASLIAYVKNFKTDVIVYIGNVIIREGWWILIISLSEIKGIMFKIIDKSILKLFT
jgi:hypothetical protein